MEPGSLVVLKMFEYRFQTLSESAIGNILLGLSPEPPFYLANRVDKKMFEQKSRNKPQCERWGCGYIGTLDLDTK